MIYFEIHQPATPITGHQHVTAISLPDNCPLTQECCGVCLEGSPIQVAGWGTDDSGSLSQYLLQAEKDLFDQEECNRLWDSWGGVTSRMFCTLVENGIDSCGGDSGKTQLFNSSEFS